MNISQIAIGVLEFLKENAPKSLDEIGLAGMGDTQSSTLCTTIIKPVDKKQHRLL